MHAVLVISADEICRRRCTLVLEPDGHRVFTAGTCEEVIAALETGVIDLVVMGLDVPGLDPARCVTHLWESDVPVVMLGSMARASDSVPFWLPDAWVRSAHESARLRREVAAALGRSEERRTPGLGAAVGVEGAWLFGLGLLGEELLW
jgi:DNA-binding response OmpR family regulator